MPSHDEHCQYTFERYGVTGEEIHEWMDEPAKLLGSTHRKARHDPRQNLPKYLIQMYGESLAKNIMIDHLLLDSETKTGEKLLSKQNDAPENPTGFTEPGSLKIIESIARAALIAEGGKICSKGDEELNYFLETGHLKKSLTPYSKKLKQINDRLEATD